MPMDKQEIIESTKFFIQEFLFILLINDFITERKDEIEKKIKNIN